MYNLSAKFVAFYNNHVVLPQKEKDELRKKKDLNITRLKEGLKEYNQEKGTTYAIVEVVEQGSVAMSTVTQHDEKEYDIDIAVVFDKFNIPDGTTAVKNIVENALQRKCQQFNTEPEAKTNCVRVEYADGYHVDFAVYRRSTNWLGETFYEHCGSEWRPRDPRAITKWFNEKNDASGDNLRKVVRLLKMFCKSRSGWSMPGGLILSVLAAECIRVNERLDKTFYDTITAIRDRLAWNQNVENPVDSSLSLILTAKDKQKVKNLKSRLETYISKLSVLFEEDCTESKALAAWREFFNHSYWGELINDSVTKSFQTSDSQYRVDIEVKVEWKRGVLIPLSPSGTRLPKKKKLHFRAIPNFREYTRIEWEVQNEGDECGQDTGHFQTGLCIEEYTAYRGTHKMICRVYNGSKLVCSNEVLIPIR
jgi:hypothetical protein